MENIIIHITPLHLVLLNENRELCKETLDNAFIEKYTFIVYLTYLLVLNGTRLTSKACEQDINIQLYQQATHLKIIYNTNLKDKTIA